MVQHFLHQNRSKLKFDENQKSGLKCHQEHVTPKNRQKINFDQNFGRNNFLEPDFVTSEPSGAQNRQNSMCFEHPFVITTPKTQTPDIHILTSKSPYGPFDITNR